jgi:5-methylcytosine-specific restriction endonuclease McrA
MRSLTNQEVFIPNSTYARHRLKDRIIMEGLLDYVCAICRIEPMWESKPLTLVLDHINGVNNDHRLQNLRFLCPNCNSQTDTFSVGHKRMRKRET